MGSVTIEIEIGDRVDTIICSPVQAAIINYCSEREISTVEEISKALISKYYTFSYGAAPSVLGLIMFYAGV